MNDDDDNKPSTLVRMLLIMLLAWAHHQVCGSSLSTFYENEGARENRVEDGSPTTTEKADESSLYSALFGNPFANVAKVEPKAAMKDLPKSSELSKVLSKSPLAVMKGAVIIQGLPKSFRRVVSIQKATRGQAKPSQPSQTISMMTGLRKSSQLSEALSRSSLTVMKGAVTLDQEEIDGAPRRDIIKGLPKSAQKMVSNNNAASGKNRVLSQSSLAVIKGAVMIKDLPKSHRRVVSSKKATRGQAKGQTIAMITGLPKRSQLSRVLSASNGDENSPHAVDEGILEICPVNKADE